MKGNLASLLGIFMISLIFLALFLPSPLYVLPARSDKLNNIDAKLSPALLRLLNNRNNGKRIQILVLFKNHNDLELRNKYLNSLSIKGLEEIETYQIIPAALYSVPINEIKRLATLHIIKKIYLNEKFQAIPPYDVKTQYITTKSEVIYNESVPRFINADKLWSSFNGSGIRIAILDTGISSSHPDLKGKIVLEESFVQKKYNFDFDENATDFNGHGTHVAGIAAGTGVASNGMYRGVAPGAEIINAKCLNMFGQGTTAAILKAIDWTVSAGADVISMSLGSGIGDPNDPISIAVENAVKKGIVVAAAAGNSGPYYSSVNSPGAAYGVITVGACNWKGQIASFSSRGPTLTWSTDPDVLAPGVDVIAPLAPDSFLQRAGKKLGMDINGTYISLSGTSMATPAVAGAVALLLQAFPSLRKTNPYAIRIALMKTAKSIDLGENIQGAGIIDVYEAYHFLDKNLKGNSLPVIDVIPTAIPQPPQIVRFPGDEAMTNVIVLSGSRCSLRIQVEGNVTNFVHFENSTLSNVFGVVTLGIELKIPIATVPGRYTGQINFINSSSGSEVLANISLDVEIVIPKARVLFDWYHNFDFSDSPWCNYYLFATLLANMSIDLDVSEGILTLEKLEEYDVLVLPDVELMFTPDEEYAIQRFLEDGGSLLVLGSFYRAFAADPLNRILAPFGVSFTNKTISKENDLGIVQLLEEVLNITKDELAKHPITNGVQSITWVAGVALKTSKKIGVSNIAYLEGNTVIAAINETATNGGRIVVFGCERNFYDDLMEKNPSHVKLGMNVFDWLLEKENDVLLLLGNYTYRTGVPIQLAVYILNQTIRENDVNVTVIGSDVNFTVPLSSVGKGILKGNVTLMKEGVYLLEVTYGTKVIKKCYVRVSSNIPVVTKVSNTLILGHPSGIEKKYPSWVKYVEGIDIICRLNDSIEITANVVSNDTNLKVTLYLSPYLQFSDMSRQELTFESIPMNKNGNVWVARFSPGLNSFSDMYVYYVVAKDSRNNTVLDMSNATGMFLLVDIEPDVYSNSTIKGQTVEEINKTVKAIGVSLGDVIPFKIYGNDTESANNRLEAFALVVDYDIYAISGLPLLVFKGRLTEDGWQGEIHIPENGTVKTPLGNVTLHSPLVVFLILRDSDGQVGYQYVILYVTTGIIIPSLSSLFLMFVIAVIALVVVLATAFVLYRKKRRKRYLPLPEYYPTYQIMNYCPYCGAKLPLGARYCPFCGAKLIENEKSRDEHSKGNNY